MSDYDIKPHHGRNSPSSQSGGDGDMHKVGPLPTTPTETDGLCVQVRAVLTRQEGEISGRGFELGLEGRSTPKKSLPSGWP